MEGTDFTIEGVPSTLEGAQDLWRRDKYHFQKWAVEQADGFVTTKQTADGGVDGRIYYAAPGEPDLQSMVVEVKGGANVSIQDLRALKGVLGNGRTHGGAYRQGAVRRGEGPQLQPIHGGCGHSRAMGQRVPTDAGVDRE